MSQENPSIINSETLSTSPENGSVSEAPSLHQDQSKVEGNDHQKAEELAQDIQQMPSPAVEEFSQAAAPGIESREAYIKEAEKIIDQDQGDPAQEERDHEAIQRRYVQDIYGKSIAKSGEDLDQK